MKKHKHEPRICIICGKEYIPRRSDQRTCGSDECMRARQRLNYLEYRRKNYAAVLETNRRCMAKRREERMREKEPPKRGEWIDFKNGWKCSACGKWNNETTNFCPNCGAKMKGKDNE